MTKLTVIADDITGANATGILLRKIGWSVSTLLDHRASIERMISSWDAVVWNAGSRLLPPGEAGERVRRMALRIRDLPSGETIQLAKRIDSTLRGAIGQETEAILEACPPGTVAAVVPSYPASGRITRGGKLFVHGVPVHQTEIGRDPYSPVRSPDVVEIIRSQTTLPVERVETGRVRDLKNALIEAVNRGAKIVVCDAESDREIEHLADVWASLDIPVLPVDPGPFTAAYAAAKSSRKKRLLLVSGSMAATARRQLEVLQQTMPIGTIDIDLNQLGPGNFDRTVREIGNRMDQLLSRHRILLLRTDRVPYAGPERNPSRVLARAVREWLSTRSFDGLYLSGGEVAFAVLQELGAEALELLEEILPLCVMARIAGGPHDGLNIVTKGGSVGDEEAVVTCIRSLLRAL